MRAALLLLALVGCAGMQVRSQTSSTDGLISTARDNGAQKCAPVELAMAESHNDYAEHALDEGNYYDAAREADVAEKNAKLAIERSPRERCVPKKAPGDRDHDGITDDIDKCPDEPEDKDGFQDEDGCPDPDNDFDGIPDKDDKCPMDPEDKDGFEDEDGCPDLDNDGDGIPDKDDKCPNEAEDKDGFEDEDGCPDPDNDKDGIADTKDKCPNEPETVNGYQDEDGCPDEVPAPVKKFMGPVQGINFATNQAKVLPSSFPVLDKAVKVMTDFPEVRFEISGHTDDRGTAEYNKDLSQWRAQAVKDYLVGKGIAAERMTALGFGRERPIADNKTTKGRSENRRTEFKLISESTNP